MGRALITSVAVLFVAMTAAGCVENSPSSAANEDQVRRQFVSKTAPSPQHRLDVRFEDKVRLLGYDIEPPEDRIRAGTRVTVTWYWQVDRPLESGWLQFTHVEDASGTPRINLDGEGPVRQGYPPDRWRRGEYIKDVQTITLDDSWGSPGATLRLGFWRESHRIRVVRGQHQDNRALGVTFRTGITPRPPGAAEKATPAPGAALPSLVVRRASGPIEIDGQLEDAPWRESRTTARFVNTMNGSPAQPNAQVVALWDDENLYIGFKVEDENLKSTFTTRDANLWEQDAVEIMIDHDGDGANYVELQVSPAGVIFDTRFDRPREPAAPGHRDYDSGLRAAVNRRGGTLNDDSDTDRGYDVEIAIPWRAFSDGATPRPGQTWRANFFVMDIPRGGGGQRAVGWSAPRVGDFHTLARFGRLLFTGAMPPAAIPSAGGATTAGDGDGGALRTPAAGDGGGAARLAPGALPRSLKLVRPLIERRQPPAGGGGARSGAGTP
ncbi:MAG: carbohydrate-binding family 9-like protein [Deltaproteobacteria bacterium]|nr:carbohydrate-binding family 9-like protein [Deltaproteobacteria bacterium]